MLQSILHWLLMPLSGATHHEISPWAAWHGRCMVLAWSVLLPLGVLCARFFKITPGQNWPQVLDNKAWWKWHQILQYGGLLLMATGILLIVGHAAGSGAAARWHARGGWLIGVLGALQMLSGWLRGSKGGPGDAQLRGDHYDMTARRRVFEWLHKFGGYLALLLAALVTFSGLWVADAPRWMALCIALWWCLLLLAFAFWQKQGRCIDTWQAIWGPEDGAEKNYPLIGFGIRQYTARQWQEKFAQHGKKHDKKPAET